MELCLGGVNAGIATYLLLRVAVGVSGNTHASVIPVIAVRSLRRRSLLALHVGRDDVWFLVEKFVTDRRTRVLLRSEQTDVDHESFAENAPCSRTTLG